MQTGAKSLTTLIRLAVVLVPLLVAALFWAFYRYQVSSAAKGVTAAQSSASPSKSQQTAPIDERLSNAERAIMFSSAPLTALPAVMTPIDPDPVASFRQLIALPPGTAREAPRIDPRRIRTMVDRGVVEYASAKTDGDRARGARLIQTAALVGYPPARDLLARNYPQSEAVRSVVPAKDVIRYALVPVMAAASEDSKQIFLALGQHFAVQGQLDVFATEILELVRGDSRPQLIHRVDTLVDLLARVPGACGALARLVPGAGKAADQECSFSENLRKFIETTRSSAAEQEEESKRRGLLMLNQARRTLARCWRLRRDCTELLNGEIFTLCARHRSNAGDTTTTRSGLPPQSDITPARIRRVGAPKDPSRYRVPSERGRPVSKREATTVSIELRSSTAGRLRLEPMKCSPAAKAPHREQLCDPILFQLHDGGCTSIALV